MNSKQNKFYTILALTTLALLVVGTTYAYFQNQYGSASNADVNVTTYTTDMLTFETGNAISLYADQTTFGQEKGSLSGETFAKATLVANNKTNEATDNYYVYFNIENNTFKYTLGEDKPELILTVTGPDGNEVTEISGLTHKVVQDRENKSISGFDVTTMNGIITIVNKKTITASPSKEEQYTLKLTFVNYEGDQTANATSGLSAKVMIQKEPMVNSLASYITNLYTGTQGENGIYYHDASLTNGAGDNSYRFAGASDQVNNYVCFGSNVTPCPTDNLYRIIGVFGDQVKLIKYDYATSTLLGADGDYSQAYTATWNDSSFTSKYIGNNLANIAGYTWNYKNNPSINYGSGSNEWSTSLFNKTNLNTNYLNKIGTTWSNLIEDTTWKVSGHTTSSVRPKVMYTAEITNATRTYGPENGTSKIGLMYVSDYGFAAAPSAWTSDMNSYSSSLITSVNWMYMGLIEWTITPNSSNSGYVFYLGTDGNLATFYANNRCGARPVLYLKDSVAYAGGSGTKDSPITLVV